MLGGTSSLNVMAYMRGNPNDFDNWAKLTGDLSWSYENVLPYFKKSEDYSGNYPDRMSLILRWDETRSSRRNL